MAYLISFNSLAFLTKQITGSLDLLLSPSLASPFLLLLHSCICIPSLAVVRFLHWCCQVSIHCVVTARGIPRRPKCRVESRTSPDTPLAPQRCLGDGQAPKEDEHHHDQHPFGSIAIRPRYVFPSCFLSSLPCTCTSTLVHRYSVPTSSKSRSSSWPVLAVPCVDWPPGHALMYLMTVMRLTRNPQFQQKRPRSDCHMWTHS